VVGGVRAGAGVAGGRGDEHAGGVGVEEGELDGVGERGAAAGDGEVDDVDAVGDGLVDRGGGVGREAPQKPQTLYAMTAAPGAMPWIGPRGMPKIDAVAGPPADVLAVWVPWPLESRALSG
jgi:hypothetical protein